MLLGLNRLVVYRLRASAPVPVHDLLWLLLYRLLVISTRHALAPSQSLLLLLLLLCVSGVRRRLCVLWLRLVMVLLIVDRRRLLSGWLHILWLLWRWGLLGRRWLLVRGRRWGRVRRLGLWWDLGVLPSDIYTAITVTRAGPPLESSALLNLRRSVIL